MYAALMGLVDLPATPIYGDNSASISLLASGVTKRSRHFAIEWFKVQDLVECKELQMNWISTQDNLTDFFTKKLPRTRFCELRDKLMGNKALQDHFLLIKCSYLMMRTMADDDVIPKDSLIIPVPDD